MHVSNNTLTHAVDDGALTGFSADKTITRPLRIICGPHFHPPENFLQAFQKPDHNEDKTYKLYTENKHGWFEKEKKTRSL